MQTAITKNNDNDMLVKLYLKRPLLIRCLILRSAKTKSNKSNKEYKRVECCQIEMGRIYWAIENLQGLFQRKFNI